MIEIARNLPKVAYIRRQVQNGKTYYSLVENKKNRNGEWRYKTIASYGTKLPTYWKPFIKQGDAINLLQCIPHDSVDLILTDPPYFMGSYKKVGEWDDFDTMEAFQKFTETWLSECSRVLRKGGVFFSFFCKFKISIITPVFSMYFILLFGFSQRFLSSGKAITNLV